MSRVILLWSGGKDAMLALCHARAAGHQVVALATFAPPAPRFLAHPLPLVRRQAVALGLPHLLVTIEAPFEQSYETALSRLQQEWILDGVVTGDIDSVGGAPNWIRERCRPLGSPSIPRSGSNLAKPCWRICWPAASSPTSPVSIPVLAPEWTGRTLDADTLSELQQLAEREGFDACGEQGEYHTMVTDGQGFAAPLRLDGWRVARRIIWPI